MIQEDYLSTCALIYGAYDEVNLLVTLTDIIFVKKTTDVFNAMELNGIKHYFIHDINEKNVIEESRKQILNDYDFIRVMPYKEGFIWVNGEVIIETNADNEMVGIISLYPENIHVKPDEADAWIIALYAVLRKYQKGLTILRSGNGWVLKRNCREVSRHSDSIEFVNLLICKIRRFLWNDPVYKEDTESDI